MGYADLSGRMAKSYSISNKTWKWPKVTLHPFAGPNHFEFIHSLKSCVGNMTHVKFRKKLVRDATLLS
jgi:hypothetical protein